MSGPWSVECTYRSGPRGAHRAPKSLSRCDGPRDWVSATSGSGAHRSGVVACRVAEPKSQHTTIPAYQSIPMYSTLTRELLSQPCHVSNFLLGWAILSYLVYTPCKAPTDCFQGLSREARAGARARQQEQRLQRLHGLVHRTVGRGQDDDRLRPRGVPRRQSELKAILFLVFKVLSLMCPFLFTPKYS